MNREKRRAAMVFRASLAALLGLCLTSSVIPAQKHSDDLLSQMFAWWNEAYKTPGAYTETAFRRYFTEDAAIVLSGKESVKGIPAMTAQFQKMQAGGGTVEIVLPFREGFTSGNKIFTYHFIRREHDGKRDCLRVMGYAVIRQQKIALVSLVRVPVDPADGPAESECRGST